MPLTFGTLLLVTSLMAAPLLETDVSANVAHAVVDDRALSIEIALAEDITAVEPEPELALALALETSRPKEWQDAIRRCRMRGPSQ